MIELGFLFWLFLAGIIIASLQDLKRREVDDWLNFLLLVAGIVFVLYTALFQKDFSKVVQMGFTLVVMFGAMNLFYYGRVFAGGDAKLLFAMSALFIGVTFLDSLINVGIFLFLLMFSGSIYGLGYSGFLYFRRWKEANKEMKNIFSKKKWIRIFCYVGIFSVVICSILFLILENMFPLIIAFIFLLFPALFLFSKALEKVCMVKEIAGKELREGDWLVHDVRVKGKTIKSDWEGLNEEAIKFT